MDLYELTQYIKSQGSIRGSKGNYEIFDIVVQAYLVRKNERQLELPLYDIQ